jgi:hypothetical protein
LPKAITEPLNVMAPIAPPRKSSNLLPNGIGVPLVVMPKASQADHAVHEGDELGHLGHLDPLRHHGAGRAADQQAEQHVAEAERRAGELDDQERGRDHGDRHADHAEQVAADRGGRVRQALQGLDEADAGHEIQQRDEIEAHDWESFGEAAERVSVRRRSTSLMIRTAANRKPKR